MFNKENSYETFLTGQSERFCVSFSNLRQISETVERERKAGEAVWLSQMFAKDEPHKL